MANRITIKMNSTAKILASKNLNDNELYNREYEKLYNKYKNKYTGSDLEYFIKQKLYSKGFKKSDL